MIDVPTLIACVALLTLLGMASVRRIPDGHVYTLHRLGRPAPRLLMPGVHLVWPLLERIAHKISLGGHTLHVQGPEGQSAHVYWQVLDPGSAAAVIEHADSLIGTQLEALWPSFSDQELRQRGHQYKHLLNASLRPKGLLITRVDLAAR